MIAKSVPVASLAALALLGGCGGGGGEANAIDALDAELVAGRSAKAVDPAAAAALHDPIMVDPMLTAQADADVVRPPPRPYAGALPHEGVAAGSALPADGGKSPPADGGKPMTAPGATAGLDRAASESITLDALAARQPDRTGADCASKLRYSAGWAHRLPAGLPLYPDARVIEAAGAQGDGCALRVVSFYAAQPVRAMLDWYYTRARRAGYSAEHRADGATHRLGGTRRRDRAAYVLFLTERADGGTDIDMVADDGV